MTRPLAYMLQVTRGNMLRMDLVTVGWKESF